MCALREGTADRAGKSLEDPLPLHAVLYRQEELHTMLVDTHAHLTASEFATDLAETMQRAAQVGVSAVVAVSESVEDAEAVLSVSGKHNAIHPALGLHPAHVTTLSPTTLAANLTTITNLIHSTPAVAAIGEVGLDYTPYVLSTSLLPTTDATKAVQNATFSHFIALSQELTLPITAHSRGAGRYALNLVQNAAKNGPVAVVMHAFDGRPIHAERALEAVPNGLYFSVPPSVVRDPGMERLVRRLPLERLLLESDSPALGPVREERNEPANVATVVPVLARVKGYAESHVRQVLCENTSSMFPHLASESVG